jgi:hypothetical protein
MKVKFIRVCLTLLVMFVSFVSVAGSTVSAATRWRVDDPEALKFAKTSLQAQVIGSEMQLYHFFYGNVPASYGDLDGAGLAFTKPWNAYAGRPARIGTVFDGFNQGDFQICRYGRAGYYIGTVGRDGKPLPLVRSGDPATGDTVADISDPAIKTFLQDPTNFRIWAAQTSVEKIIGLYESIIGPLSDIDELTDWGLKPFAGAGKNAITGGPILNDKSAGNVVIRYDGSYWFVRAYGKDGKPIPVT